MTWEGREGKKQIEVQSAVKGLAGVVSINIYPTYHGIMDEILTVVSRSFDHTVSTCCVDWVLVQLKCFRIKKN